MYDDDEDITASIPELVHGNLDTESSLLANLAAQRAEEAGDRETFIPIPGYKGIDILARYRLVGGTELEVIAKRIGGKKNGNRAKGSLWDRNIAAAMDTMSLACTGIFYQRDEDKEPKQLTVGGEPVTGYGDPLIKVAFGIDEGVNSVRKIIMSLFKKNDLAVSDHSMKLQRWFTDMDADVDEEFLGEA